MMNDETTARGLGDGGSFSMNLDITGRWLVKFFVDDNGNDVHDIGEPGRNGLFQVKDYTVRSLTFAQAANVATETNATIDAKLQAANDIAGIRDSALDRRTTIRFERSGNVATFANDADHPSIIYDNEYWGRLHANVNADVKIVREILMDNNGVTYAPGVILGRCDWSLSKMALCNGFAAQTFLHEAGHGVGLEHRTDDTKAVMFQTAGADHNVLNDDERAAYE